MSDNIANPTPKFVHLHNHTHYSLLDGLTRVDELVAHVKEMGMDAVAITDHGVMYGVIEFYQKCKKAGVKPIIGVEAYITDNMYDKRPTTTGTRGYSHLILLAKDNIGYQNLIKLVTASHLHGFYYKPRMDRNLLRQHSEGLIALSGCIGSELAKAVLSGQDERARKIISDYQEIFGKENYYLELQIHPNLEGQENANDGIIALARELNIPLVATQDSHYLRSEDSHAHDILLAVQTGNEVDDADRLSMKIDDFSVLSPETMAEKFRDIPEALENTAKIAERCNVELTLGKFIFPDFALEPGKTSDEMLDELTREGAWEHGLDNDPVAEERRRYELEIIKNKNYAPYFLVVADLLRFARESKIYTTVRGSAAGSLVAYLSGITNVNPIEMQLPFERFLNPFRPSAPDIDMDFADDRRAEVIEYAKKKYGADKVAQICTFGTMMARGAVRDVARALGKPYEFGDRISKLIPLGSQGFPMTIKHAMELESDLKQIYERDEEARLVLNVAMKLEGTVRHVSVHAAGVVIAPKPLTEYVPIQYDPKGENNIITQYDMYTVGEDGVGLTKLDFLGIRNLAILENSVQLAKDNRNLDIDIEKIPFDDKKTFAMLAKGETEGLFQLNGSGMTKHLVDLKPTTIHDINAMVALYRPGPMNNIPEYIARKHGKSPIKFFHPKAEKFLDKSYGILVYQDDLLFTAMEIAGYNWETVDKFRKAVGKKIPAEMAKQHKIFVEGCQTHSGISEKEAEDIWNLFEPFQGYGFNKAHAACYGRVAYQTAYMKAHFPVDYMCAILDAEFGDIEKIAVIIEECRRMGIEVLAPDINESLENFSIPDVNESKIRFGLTAVKNVGENIVKAIIEERLKGGQFQNIGEFVNRVKHKDLNKKSMESLIKCGAMDRFGERAALLASTDQLLEYSRENQKSDAAGQESLFGPLTRLPAGQAAGVASVTSLPDLKLKVATPATRSEKLMWEKELLGLFIADHPLKDFEKQFSNEKNIRKIKDIAEARSNSQIKVGGMVTKIHKIITKSGEPMVFTTIEDATAKVEVVVFPGVLKDNPEAFMENKIIIVSGRISDKDGIPKLLCETVRPIATLS